MGFRQFLFMFSSSRSLMVAAQLLCALNLVVYAQDASAPKQPLEHVLGTVTSVDTNAHTVVVKDDKTGASETILLADTKTLLKVEPTAKDLKSAVRITADDLQAGDRVDVRGLRAGDTPNTLAAKSVVLMSARDLQQAHQAQAAEWQHSTAGVVSSIDGSAGRLSVTVKSADGPKQVAIETTNKTEFTRYAPENPKTPAPSQLAQIQAGDQVRIIGDKSEDGASVQARRVYSGAFRTISATVAAVAPDGKSLTVKDLATKKNVEVALTDETAVHKLPPMMATMLARRFNPNYRPPEGSAGAAGPGAGAQRPNGVPPGGPGGPPPGGGMRNGNGDISQLLERAPKIALSELKQGDALVISGVVTGADNARLLASNVIAGVEPILQSSPRQGAQGLGGDWGLGEMAVPQ